MSISLTRSEATDSYEILKSYTATQPQLELDIVSSLVKGSHDTSGNNIPDTQATWNYTKLNPQYVETSAISNYPSGSVTKNSVISLEHTTSVANEKYSVSLNLDTTTNQQDFAMLGTSSSIYDSNYVFEQSYLPIYYDNGVSSDPFYNTNMATFSAEFDLSNNFNPSQQAVNTRWNSTLQPYTSLSTVGLDTVQVEEVASFNQNSALGMEGTSGDNYSAKYASSDGDGVVSFTIIDNAYQPQSNNLQVITTNVPTSFNLSDDVGIFRFDQNMTNSVATTVQLNNYDSQVVTGELLLKMPIIDANATGGSIGPSTQKSDLQVPGTMTTDQFNSLFNADVLNTVSDNYNFSIEVTDASGGYYIDTNSIVDNSGDVMLISDLNNDNILDNPYYMANHVNFIHEIMFSDGSLNLIVEPSANAINAGLIGIDLSEGETLTTDAGINGTIKINTHSINSRTTDTIFDDMGETNATNISVFYTGENKISGAMQHNPYLYVNYEKVALRSSIEPSANVFLSNNDAFLTMYTNEIVNDNVPLYNCNFSFNKDLFSDDSIRLWRVNTQNILASDPESFYSNYDEDKNKGQNLVNGICVSSVLENLTENLVDYYSYRCKLTAKRLTDISLYSAVTHSSSSNWTINASGGFLKSNTIQAFNHTNTLPNYDSSLIDELANGTELYYSYEYKTNTDKNTYGGLVDYVEVTYKNAHDVNAVKTTFIIPDADLNKMYPSPATTNITPISESNYCFSLGPYSQEQFRLVQVVSTSGFNVSFNPNFGPFTNITLTINNIIQTDTYYVLQNKTTGKLSQLSALQYVSRTSSSTLPDDITKVNETFTTNGGLFKIEGTLTVTDLEPYMGVVEGKHINTNVWVELSDAIDFDTYYAIDNIHNLTATTDTADVNTTCEYNPFSVQQQNVELNNENYYIPYIYDSNNAYYSVQSFTSLSSTISSTTDLHSTSGELTDNHFTVTNNYACAKHAEWLSSSYFINVSDLSNNTTTFTVSDLQNRVVFTITKQSNLTFLGTQIVTYIPNDIWRSGKKMGQSSTVYAYDEIFASTLYPSNTIGFTNVPGITVDVASTNTYDIGCSVNFRVLGDYMTINAAGGGCSDPSSSNELGLSSYNGGNLLFQHVSNAVNYSAKFTFDRYRGYAEPDVSPFVQKYIISRDDISVTFNVGTTLTQVLTSNMYYNQPLTVNSLKNSFGNTFANLNIKFNALYSMPPTGAALLYPINVEADSVTTIITNSAYAGTSSNIDVPSDATPVLDPKTYSDVSSNLKTYGPNKMYTFSGLSLMTNKLVAFRPSRVKLNNAAFPYSQFKYTIALTRSVMKVYKARPSTSLNTYNYIGNPASISSGENTPYSPNYTGGDKWELIHTFSTLVDTLAGITIGKKVIRQDANKNIKHAVSYFVSTPPYYQYSCVKTISGSSNPSLYNYASLNNNQKRIVHLPFDPSNSVYNPFAQTISIHDIIGNNINISNDAMQVNNIKFTHLKPRSIFNLTSNSSTSPFGIIVPGIKLKITLYSGLYGSTVQPHLIYDGPITSIPFTTNVLTHQIVFRERDANGAIIFSLAQFPSDIGYPPSTTGYEQLFRTTAQSAYYNIDFKLDNVAWFNKNSPVTWFNANADGIKPTLYTVVDVNNHVSKVNSRRVYKYVSNSTYKTDNSLTALQTIAFSFTQGRTYYDADIPLPAFSSTATQIWNYSELLSNTPVTSVSWTTDLSFNENVYTSWAFGNSNTATKMTLDLFYLEDDARKWVYITLLPFQTMLNQYGLTISESAWDGSLYTPLVTTRVISLQPQITSPVLDGLNYQIEQYSTSSLN